MSGQAMEQSQTSAADGAQAKPGRVSADSFRMLTQRLKFPSAPAAIPSINAVSQNQIRPVVTPDPVEPSTIKVVSMPASAYVHEAGITELAMAVPAEPPPVDAGIVDVQESVATPALDEAFSETATVSPVSEIVQPASRPVEGFAVKNVPPLLSAPPSFEKSSETIPEPVPELENLRDTASILSDRIGRVLARTAMPAESGTELSLPPILPPPERTTEAEIPPRRITELNIDVIQELHRINADVKRRRDSEVENNARMIFAVPTLEERAQYLEEAAQLAQMERAEEMVRAHPVEDLEALAMEHIGKYAAGTGQLANDDQVQAFDGRRLTPPDYAASEAATESHQENAAMDEVAPEPVLIQDIVPKIATAQDDNSFESAFPESAIESTTAPKPASRPIVQKPASVEAPVHSAVQNMSEHQVSDFARSLLDMMASGSNAGLPQERALAADTLLRILPRLPQRALVQLSDRLAMMDHPPHLIVGKILQDPRIEVAGPLIENGVNLGERELISLIETGNIDKLRLVARRRRLSRVITTMLIASGQPSVLLTLVRNAHAEFAHESFVMLADAAKSEPDLLAPLCTRADLPTPQAFELFWLAPPQLRRYLLSRFLTDSETLTKILKITLATQGGELAADAEVDSVRTADALRLLGEGKLEEAYAMLSELCRTGVETIARICEDSSGEPLVAMLKILGIPRTQVQGVMQVLQRSELGVINPSRELEELQSIFDTLSNNKARILLTYWDWATQKTGLNLS
jgi:uncharacterized protein (DUF2336 family)